MLNCSASLIHAAGANNATLNFRPMATQKMKQALRAIGEDQTQILNVDRILQQNAPWSKGQGRPR